MSELHANLYSSPEQWCTQRKNCGKFCGEIVKGFHEVKESEITLLH